MMMKLNVAVNSKLPKLAWCATLTRRTQELLVHCGAWLEHGEGYFFEGAWNGPFDPAGIEAATICAASGGRIISEGVLFFTPTHTVARLHSIRKRDQLILSNSLAFLMAEASETYDDRYIFYEDDLSSTTKGLNKLRTTLPTRSGNEIHLFYHCNIVVDCNLGIATMPKGMPDPFADFGAYYSFLVNGLKDLAANARDEGRHVTYRPLVTVSHGYDSPACATLAREIACRDAITFVDSTDPVDARADCGQEIAQRLGLRVTQYEREAYKERTDMVEAEFLSVGTGGDGVYLSIAEKQLEARLFITGFNGGKVWDVNNAKVGPNIVRGDPSGADLEELRLRVGFIHLPLPFFGCLRHGDIHRISNASEMAPWRVGNSYDRPIPRRIVEEAGIPRTWFGQKKRVMSRAFDERNLRWYFGASSYSDFEAFARPRLLSMRFPRAAVFRCLRAWTIVVQTAGNMAGRFSWRLQTVVAALAPPSGRYTTNLGLCRFRFHWGMSKTIRRYFANQTDTTTVAPKRAETD